MQVNINSKLTNNAHKMQSFKGKKIPSPLRNEFAQSYDELKSVFRVMWKDTRYRKGEKKLNESGIDYFYGISGEKQFNEKISMPIYRGSKIDFISKNKECGFGTTIKISLSPTENLPQDKKVDFYISSSGILKASGLTTKQKIKPVENKEIASNLLATINKKIEELKTILR